MKTWFTPRRPALFQSVRSSRDLSLVAFAGALLVAFALHAGAFLPRLGPDAPAAEAPRIEQAPERREPAFVAARHAPAAAPATAEPDRAPAAPSPCDTPRG